MAPGSNDAPKPLPDVATLSLEREAPIPVVLVTGFLGSGKTTLIRRLLAAAALRDTAVIVNEFGEVGLDHHLVEAADEYTLLLEGGCLCCAHQGDLVRALRELLAQRERRTLPPYERVIVETSGLADPVPIMQSFLSDPLRLSRYRLAGMIALIDAVSGLEILERHALARRQAALADRLVVSKGDLLDACDRHAVMAALGRSLGREPVWVPDDDGLPSLLFDWREPHVPSAMPRHVHAAHDYVAHHLRIDQPVDRDCLIHWLAQVTAEADEILRIKGIVTTPDGMPLAIDAVQHRWHTPRPLERRLDGAGNVVVITPSDSSAGRRALAQLSARIAQGVTSCATDGPKPG